MKQLILLALLISFSVIAKSLPEHFNKKLLEDVQKDQKIDDEKYKKYRAPASVGEIKTSKPQRLEDQEKQIKPTEKLNQRQIGNQSW